MDHYPLMTTPPQCARCGEHEPPGMLHVCADILAQLTTPPIPPIAQPFVPAPPAPAAPQRFVRQGYYDICVTCKLAREWCACARQEVETAAPDGAHSDLSKRIRELRGPDNR